MAFSQFDARKRAQKLNLTLMAWLAAGSFLLFSAVSAYALFGPSVMYSSPPGTMTRGTLYARAIRLQHSGAANGTLLATFSVDDWSGMPSFPIYESTDAGKTWKRISSVTDQVNGWGMRWEPDLYELPHAIGTMPAGTILCAGNSVPADKSATKIDIYMSADHGHTWTFLSSVATGGPAYSQNGHTPVWEPFLMVANDKLIVYYSDQRDPKHGQKIVHQTSPDGVHWGPVVNDVTYPDYSARPGMPVVAKMGNGKYIMTYEYGGAPETNFAVYYKIASNPEDFGSARGRVLTATDGTVPSSSPYVTWLPAGGPDGTLVVSAYSNHVLFLNTHYGAPGDWTEINSNAGSGYSRALLPMSDGHTLFVISGGPLFGTANSVTYGTVDLGGGISDGAVYTVSNANSKLALAIGGRSTGEGVVQSTATGATDQQWRFDLQADGYYTITNINSGKALGVAGQAAGNDALQLSDNNRAGREWAVQNAIQGGYTIINRLSGLDLAVRHGSMAGGAMVDQRQDKGTSSQRWNLTQISPPKFDEGQFVLINKNSGKYLNVRNNSTADGATVDQWKDSGYYGQIWRLSAADGGYYKIANVHSGKVLEVTGASTAAGATVTQYRADGGSDQQWKPVATGSGYFKLVNRNSGMVLGIRGDSTFNGAAAIQLTGSGSTGQQWKLIRID